MCGGHRRLAMDSGSIAWCSKAVTILGDYPSASIPPVVNSRVHAATTGLRRSVPNALVPHLVSARARLRRLNKARWAAARAEMRFILGDAAPEAQIDALAYRQLWRLAWRSESIFHPEMVTNQGVLGEQRLREALRHGKGCLLSVMHHADYEAGVGSLAKRGFPIQVMTTTGFFAPRMSNVMRLERDFIAYGPDVEIFNVALGSDAVRERLRGGHSVVIAMDPPGRTHHRLFGRDVWMSSGGVHAAWDLDAPTIVMTQTPDRHDPKAQGTVNLSEPLFPHDFPTVESMLQEIVRQHEAAIFAWPDAAAWNWPFQLEMPVGPRAPL